ncbi:hypothetical protein ACJQWK_05915 [Exserohilum turcicum]
MKTTLWSVTAEKPISRKRKAESNLLEATKKSKIQEKGDGDGDGNASDGLED